MIPEQNIPTMVIVWGIIIFLFFYEGKNFISQIRQTRKRIKLEKLRKEVKNRYEGR